MWLNNIIFLKNIKLRSEIKYKNIRVGRSCVGINVEIQRTQTVFKYYYIIN